MVKRENEADVVQGQLNKILAAAAFRHSITLSRFLQFIVDETLAGRGSDLKEYTIALMVLSKKPDFNPQNDPIVRIHAGRLRRCLHEYYLQEGKADHLIITVPKGAYVPVFTQRESGAEPGAPVNKDEMPARRSITVAVLPFTMAGANPNTESFADALADQISTELTRYSELSIISYYSCRSIISKISDIKEAGLLLDARYILTGTVQASSMRLRIRVQLILAETREQIWANSYERESTAEQLFEVQDDIVWRVVSETAGHYGAISRNIARLRPQSNPEDIGIYNAIFWYYHFVGDLSLDMFYKAENAMHSAVTREPSYALGWAVLGEIWVGGYFMGYKSRIADNQLEQAVVNGKTSLRIDPNCQHGYQTIALANIFLHNREESLKTIEEWQRMKPGEAGIQGAMGFILICCGEYERGFTMLEESVQLNPYYQWWFNAGFAFYHFKNDDFQSAYYWAEKMNRPEVPWELLLKIACCYKMNLPEPSGKLSRQLKREFPVIPAILEEYLSAVLKDIKLVQKLKSVLVEAGLQQPG